jgi:deoxyribodipyrimidine photo-lyase
MIRNTPSDTRLLASRAQMLSEAFVLSGDTVIYVMSRDQRVRDNHALYTAQKKAFELKLPLVVAFNLLPKAGVRAREQYEFMLDGLEEVADDLQKLGITFVMVSGNPAETIPKLCEQLMPAHIYFDFNSLSGVRGVQQQIADEAKVPCSVVDTHNIIPVWVTSDKQEFAAHTIRRKVHKHLELYLTEPEQIQLHPYPITEPVRSLSFEQARHILAKLPACGIKHGYSSGERAAREHLRGFITNGLHGYARARNNIANDRQSGLSPYLHFGQISSLRVALEVLIQVNAVPLLFSEPRMASVGDAPTLEDDMNVLFEEIIVRKELADNFCMHSDHPINLHSSPDWAQKTLAEHNGDAREHLYTLNEFDRAKTHDEIWNAAQLQLTMTGKLHGYMRMYWAKKILEWTPDAQAAIDYAVYLNDHYSLDGGDPNGYVGILWAIAGLHDRSWAERPIFGKVRYMNAAGLKRKFDVDAYVAQWGWRNE